MKNTCRPAWPQSGCACGVAELAGDEDREQQHVADDADRPGPDQAPHAEDRAGEAERVADDLAHEELAPGHGDGARAAASQIIGLLLCDGLWRHGAGVATYLAMTSTSRLTGSPGCLKPRVVRRERLGDQADGEAVVARLDDGEADAVDGDRALVDDVAGEVGGQRDLDDLPVLARGAASDRPDAVDVALHDVAAEPGRRAVTARSRLTRLPGLRAAERGLVEGLLHHVGGERARRSRSARR